MSGINLIKRFVVVAALVLTLAGGALSSAYAPSHHAGVQVAQKDASDGQETHG